MALYELLIRYDPSPVVRLNRAVALSHLGPEQIPSALAKVDALATGWTATTCSTPRAPSCSPPWAATTRPTPPTPAPSALTANEAERRLLTTRLHRHPLDDGS